ncbi:syntaxin-like [Centruroides vittatus]|uniref:syntaxin-like n=1 Tax=Centruroides vittatus TaxID=120091 RepID=UPI003510BCC7
MDSIRRLPNKTQAKLKLMEQDIEDEKSNTVTTEFRIRQAQLNALTQQLVDIMSDFNQIQTEYKKKYEDHIKKQLKITGQEITDEQLQDMLEQRNPSIFIKNIVMETKKAQETLDDINACHADIMKLERNIIELHEMFMDMTMIIENQGEIIDRIEFNVQNTVEYAEKAKTEIVQTLELQKKSRKLKIIIHCSCTCYHYCYSTSCYCPIIIVADLPRNLMYSVLFFCVKCATKDNNIVYFIHEYL